MSEWQIPNRYIEQSERIKVLELERDALAAQLERLKDAGNEIRHELAQWALTERDPETTAAMCQFDHIARETPSTSFACHPDDAAVNRFATAMKSKLAVAREKGRGGWNDPDRCSVELLAALLMDHLQKGNEGNYVDIANLAMMLHLRMASPELLTSELAHLKAQRQAEAVKEFADEVWNELLRHGGKINVMPLTMAKKWIKRRQAEGGEG